MTTFQGRNCDLCEAQHLTSKSEIWCPNCEESLCSKCKVQHSVAKVTKTHKTIPIEKFEKLPPFVQEINQECTDHHEKFEFFCSHHDTACCVKCLKTTHSKCHDTLTSLSEVVEGFKSSKCFTDLEVSVKDIVSNIKVVCNFQQSNFQLLKEEKELCEKKITDKRQEINSKLEEMEKKIREELSSRYENHKTMIEDKICELKAREKQMVETQNILENIKSDASEFQAYFGIQKISKDTQKEDHFLQTFLNSENQIVQIDLELECSKPQKMETELFFGKIKEEENLVEIQLAKTLKIEAQIGSATASSAVSGSMKRKTSFSLTLKGFKRSITGCTTTTDGYLIFSDFENKCLIFVDQTGRHINTVSLCHQPSDIACFGGLIVIAFTALDQVNIFQLNLGTTIQTLPCDGQPISVFIMNNNNLVVSIAGYGFKIFNNSPGGVTKCIKAKLKNPHYFVVVSDKIFYTDWESDKVICIDMQGKLIFQRSFENLKGPIGITVDDTDNIYVCGFKSHNVFILSKDKQQCKEIISKSEGIIRPGCLHYIQEKLLVVANEFGNVHLYTVVS